MIRYPAKLSAHCAESARIRRFLPRVAGSTAGGRSGVFFLSQNEKMPSAFEMVRFVQTVVEVRRFANCARNMTEMYHSVENWWLVAGGWWLMMRSFFLEEG